PPKCHSCLFRMWAVLGPMSPIPISASSCQGSCFISEIPCVGICRPSFQHDFQLKGNIRKLCLSQSG
uniref:Uncharacterized protein n=1 Tax=Strigops habroptila TaxID=2489341 RepID=A0A672TLX3_STRHB